MNSVRWLSPVLCLLGVVLTVRPSEAASVSLSVPTVSITTEDGTFTIPFTDPSGNSCSPTDTTAGFTACYPIKTGSYPNLTDNGFATTNTWVITSDSATNPARLLVADVNGAGNSLDQAFLTGIHFQPSTTASQLSFKQLTVSTTVSFDAVPNVITPAGPVAYQFAQRAGGYLVGGTDNSLRGDSFNVSGMGWFGAQTCGDGCTKNFVPITPALALSPSVINSGLPRIGFSLGHTKPYPTFNCNTASGEASPSCSPIITQIYTFASTNRDILVLSNSGEGAGTTCFTLSGANIPVDIPTGFQLGVPNGFCGGSTNAIATAFAANASADKQAAQQAGAVILPPRCKAKHHGGGGNKGGDNDDDGDD